MIPSILCAAAGPLSYRGFSGVPQEQSPSSDAPSFTHAVHFRLPANVSPDHILQHPLHKQAFQGAVQQLCLSSAQLVFQGCVANQLEALFRRGEEYEVGIEHIMLMHTDASRESESDMFLSRLATLAESSVAGGLQSSYGKAIFSSSISPTHVFMTRFATEQQVGLFLQTPACLAALQQDKRLPVQVAMSLCLNIAPTEQSNNVKTVAL
eukprot:jgi/Chrzof1/13170/Cz07g22180.t1